MNAYFKLGSYAASFFAGVFAMWLWHNASISRIEKNQAESEKIAIEKARDIEKDWQGKVDAAIEEGENRAKKLYSDAVASRNASNKLRVQLSELQQKLPNLTEEAVRKYANAASIVFGECQSEYQSLAEQADKIDSDRKTLEDAWPK